MRLVRALLLLALPLVLLAPAAHADTSSKSDVAKDVRSYEEEVDDVQPAGPISYDPAHDNGDLTGVRVRHDTTTVRVVLSFRALRAQGSNHEYAYRLRTGTLERKVVFSAYPSYWQGTTVFFSKPDGTPVDCTGKRTIDYGANTVKLSVPTSCLGKPTKVGVAVKVTQLELGVVSYDKGYARGGHIGTDVYGPYVRR